MFRPVITVIGGSTQDVVYYTDQALILDNKKDLLRRKLIAFEYGAKLHSQKVYFSYGGGGANTAVTLASLGLRTSIITTLGDDALGRDILANLRERDVSLALVQKPKGARTALSVVVNVGESHEHVLFSYRGANDYLKLSEPLWRWIKSPWVYLNSLAKMVPSDLRKFFDYCQTHKIKLAWNPDARQIDWGWQQIKKCLYQGTVLIVNRDEALELAVSAVGRNKVKNNIAYLFRFLQAGQYLTVITDGPRGAYVFDGRKIYFRRATNHKPISTLGAGDAFGSAFIAGLIKYHGDINRALKLGILNSGSVVSKIGAQAGILHRSKLRRFGL